MKKSMRNHQKEGGKNIVIPKNAKIGKNSVIRDNVIIYDNVELGDNCFVGPNSILGEPTAEFYNKKNYQNPPLKIGKGSIIRSYTILYGGSTISDNLKTGHGAIIRERNKIGNNVSIGCKSELMPGNKIGNNVKIHSNCIIGEFAIIEDNVWIGPSVVTLATLHPPCPKSEECAVHDPINIKRNAKIGGNVTILPGVVIGENSLIGGGTVVTKNAPPDTVVIGNPGKAVKKVDELTCKEKFYKIPYEWEIKK